MPPIVDSFRRSDPADVWEQKATVWDPKGITWGQKARSWGEKGGIWDQKNCVVGRSNEIVWTPYAYYMDVSKDADLQTSDRPWMGVEYLSPPDHDVDVLHMSHHGMHVQADSPSRIVRDDLDEAASVDSILAVAVRALSAQDQAVLLQAIDGLDAASIAVALGVTQEAARVQLGRARRRLLETLEAVTNRIVVSDADDASAELTETTVLRGRVLRVEGEQFVAVAGLDTDEMELVVRLPVLAAREPERSRLKPGRLFKWTLERWQDSQGGLVARSSIALNSSREFSPEERAQIDARAAQIAAQLAQFVPPRDSP